MPIKTYRKIPYKLIEKGELVGACEYFYNNKTYLNSLKCYKDKSIMYKIDSDKFFERIFVEENPPERIRSILMESLTKNKR